MSGAVRIGVDLGGTKIEAVALDSAGCIVERRRAPTPAGDYNATVATVVELVRGLELATASVAHVGVGTPGAVSLSSGLIKNSNSTCLNGRALHADLERALQRPVRIANDADCMTLSEAVDGAGSDATSVFGVIIGTGTGGGIVINGRLLAGPNRITGEWGHNPLPWMTASEWPGAMCYCGKRGCIETYLSGPAMSGDYRGRGGGDLLAEQIVERAANGEPTAQATLSAYHDRMARALASVINVLDPHVIVVGGGLSNVASIYTEVPRLWQRYVFSDHVNTRLLRARHGDSSGVRGAAWLWPSD